MSTLKYSKNRDKYVRDIIDVAWLGIEDERGYMSFHKKYIIVLRVADSIDNKREYTITEEFWWYANNSKENLINEIKEFINKYKNVTVQNLYRVEAKYTTFD